MGTYFSCWCKDGCCSCLNCSLCNFECFHEHLGFEKGLWDCCGNCNLLCYIACCPSCVWADIHAGLRQEGPQIWWNTLMLLLACPTLTWIFGALGKDFAIVATLFSAINPIVWVFVIYKVIVQIADKYNIEYGDCTCTCCLTYLFCFSCHSIQAAREIEKDQTVQNDILRNRPEVCQCCNCWVVELGDTTERESAQLIDAV